MTPNINKMNRDEEYKEHFSPDGEKIQHDMDFPNEPNIKPEWEKEWDKRFPFAIIDWKIGKEGDGDGTAEDIMKDMKDFIHNLLSQRDKELEEMTDTRAFEKRKYNGVWQVLNASNDIYAKYKVIEALIDGILSDVNKDDSLVNIEKADVNKPEWKKEFDEKFVVLSNAGTPLLRYTDAALIKSFIHNLLSQRDKELTEKIEGMKSGNNEDGFFEKDSKAKVYERGVDFGWNSALEEVIRIIKQ